MRAHLIAKYERHNRLYGHLRVHNDATYPDNPSETEREQRRATSWFADQIAGLAAGEPVEVFAWQIPKEARPGGTNDRVRIETNNTVTLLVRRP